MSLLHTLFGGTQDTTILGTLHTPLDMVIHAASLVSNPSGIDPLLDQVRAMTAELSSGEHVSKVDEQRLVNIYLRIEDYLVTEEPLRVFQKDELRESLAPELLQILSVYENKLQKGI